MNANPHNQHNDKNGVAIMNGCCVKIDAVQLLNGKGEVYKTVPGETCMVKSREVKNTPYPNTYYELYFNRERGEWGQPVTEASAKRCTVISS